MKIVHPGAWKRYTVTMPDGSTIETKASCRQWAMRRVGGVDAFVSQDSQKWPKTILLRIRDTVLLRRHRDAG